MNVGIAYPAFFSAFKQYYPQLEVIDHDSGNITRHLSKFDLVIFSGGEDIHPSFYREINKYSNVAEYPSPRDEIERSILMRILDLSNRPNILGVCRGHQLIHIIFGAGLVQDINSQLNENHGGGHKIDYLKSFSMTEYIFGNEEVNSLHHQGVHFAHNNSSLKTTSKFGHIIESSESENIYTVQFHPEFMNLRKGGKFFNVVNKWVKNREGLIKEIKEALPEQEEQGIYKKAELKRSTLGFTTTLNWTSTTGGGGDFFAARPSLGRPTSSTTENDE